MYDEGAKVTTGANMKQTSDKYEYEYTSPEYDGKSQNHLVFFF